MHVHTTSCSLAIPLRWKEMHACKKKLIYSNRTVNWILNLLTALLEYINLMKGVKFIYTTAQE